MANARQVEFLISGVTDSNGDPLASGKVYFYEPGTTTSKTIWTDAAKTSAASNPVVLDARGSAEIFAEGLYDIKIDDSDDNNLSTWDDQKFQVGEDVAGSNSVSSVESTMTETTVWATTGSEDWQNADFIDFQFGFEIFNSDSSTNNAIVRVYLITTEIAEFTIDDIGTDATFNSVGLIHGVVNASRSVLVLDFTDTVGGTPDPSTGEAVSVTHHQICSNEPGVTFDGTDQMYVTVELSASSANFSFIPTIGYARAMEK